MILHEPVAAVAVTARGWSWRYAGRRAWAVRDLDLVIQPGERVLVLGASGSGKSTLLEGVAGVLGGDNEGETSGELLIDGLSPRSARGRVGLVMQDPDAQVILGRVGDDVAFGCENLGVPRDEIWRRVVEALECVGLDLGLGHPTDKLSGGEKQRLALAGVLAMRPGLIVFDEPTANLDPAGVAQVRAAVARVVAETGATLIVVEHRVAVWRELIDRIIVLGPGQGVLADGTPDEVLGERGAELSAAGIWVPGFDPEPLIRTRYPAEPVMTAQRVAVGRTPETIVRDSIDLVVEAGRMLAVTGSNGVGKSTLGLSLGGLLPVLAGKLDATPLGGELGGDPFRWKSRDLLPRVSTVFQDPEHQFVAGTVRAELEVGPKTLRMSRREVDATVAELIVRLRLESLLEANPFTLSGGEKRRLSVATALATQPRMLVLDEPTFGQDSRTWAELITLLAAIIDDGTAVVAVTHDAELVAMLADSEYRMERE